MNGTIITTTTITSKGQVTIPDKLRELFDISQGDRVSFTQISKQNKRAVMEVISSKVVDEVYGSLKSNKKAVPLAEVRRKSGLKLAEKYGLRR